MYGAVQMRVHECGFQKLLQSLPQASQARRPLEMEKHHPKQSARPARPHSAPNKPRRRSAALASRRQLRKLR